MSTATLLAITVATALATPAFAQARFPDLKPDGACPESFELRLQDGPDFYIWRCELSESGGGASSGSGIYFGLHPSSSQPDTGVTHHSGTIGGQKVRWQQWREAGIIRREAIFDYQHSAEHLTLHLHAFVAARSEDELRRLLEALSTVKFSDRGANSA